MGVVAEEQLLQRRGLADQAAHAGCDQCLQCGLERLGIHSVDDLAPLGDFVPDASVVEALERGLRISDDPVAPADDGAGPAG